IVNLANRQRKFVPDYKGWHFYPIGKKLPKDGVFIAPLTGAKYIDIKKNETSEEGVIFIL
ncbi:MAG: hypothetical protein MJ210_05770, partial [Alphaproteobacteria bacterium]|nr:hypothetical protein [Alphaproteobacteria bacterium]